MQSAKDSRLARVKSEELIEVEDNLYAFKRISVDGFSSYLSNLINVCTHKLNLLVGDDARAPLVVARLGRLG